MRSLHLLYVRERSLFVLVTTFKLPGNPSTWKTRGAAFGLFGGLMAPILGSIFTVISWFIDSAWHGVSLRNLGTSLFVVAIPLLILGAHCLDLLDND